MSAKRPGDLELAASVKPASVRFGDKPEVSVEGASTHSTRENLPDEVEPGVTYRDVRVRWRAEARVTAASPRSAGRSPAPRPPGGSATRPR
jgi:hypothetical protein